MHTPSPPPLPDTPPPPAPPPPMGQPQGSKPGHKAGGPFKTVLGTGMEGASIGTGLAPFLGSTGTVMGPGNLGGGSSSSGGSAS